MAVFNANMHQIRFLLGLCDRPRWEDSLVCGEKVQPLPHEVNPSRSALRVSIVDPSSLRLRPFGPQFYAAPASTLKLSAPTTA